LKFVDQHGVLTAKHGRILDAHGDSILLNGVSLFESQHRVGERFYNEDVVKWLVENWNIDVIRAALGVAPDGYLTHPDRERNKITRVVDAAVDSGIYVIIDWHAHQQHTHEAKEFFIEMACQYRECDNVIFELWNEPERHDWSSIIKPYHQALIKAIRDNGANNLVIAGTQWWSQGVDIAASDPLNCDNVAYALHFYAGSADHKAADLRTKTKNALNNGAAIFVSEYGTCNHDGNGQIDENEMKCWWDFLQQNCISHVNWSICDKNEAASVLMNGIVPCDKDVPGNWQPAWLSASGELVRQHIKETRKPAGN
jgi:endoglucanase